MSVLNPQKSVSPAAIECQGTATVTLGFDAAASLTAQPADIVLIMDRSSSMDNRRMFFARRGAGNLMKMVSAASTGDDSADFVDSRVGIVSFSTEATADVPLTTSRALLRTAIASLRAGGDTNHAAAFEAAEAMLGPKGTNRQVAIMFTDGMTTTGGDATPITDRMKAAGIEIYCIGLVDDPALLNRWASEPLAEHVSATNDEKELDTLFSKVASRTVLAGAQNVLIRETLSPEFRIVTLNAPAFGTAKLEGDRSILWTMDYAGVNLDPETYALSFEMVHTGSTGGSKAFNQSLVYQDEAGTALQFPSPSIQVTCSGGGELYPEPCPEPTMFTVPGCQDAAHVTLMSVSLQGLGRIVQVDATLKAVCPGKRVAASILLMEVASDGTEIPRGVKHILVPAQTGEACQDITLNCIQFSLPEALDAVGTTDSICNARQFTARVIANYVDTDFTCCEANDQTV